MPSISVIIPCFNVEHYIEECVDSAFVQTKPPIEVICVDNGSSDGTLELLTRLQIRYKGLKVLVQPKKGANAARNSGTVAAIGDWIQYLDADDLLAPDKLAHQSEIVCGDPGLSFVAGAYTVRAVDGSEVVILPDNSAGSYYSVFSNRSGITSANLFSRKAVNDVGGWDESLLSSQETELMIRIVLNSGKFCVDKRPLTVVRGRPSGQISQRNPSDRIEQYIKVRLLFLRSLIKSRTIDEKEIGRYNDFLCVSILLLAKHDRSMARKYFAELGGHNRATHFSSGIGIVKNLLLRLLGFSLASRLLVSKN